jgi:hypothetical protein
LSIWAGFFKAQIPSRLTSYLRHLMSNRLNAFIQVLKMNV